MRVSHECRIVHFLSSQITELNKLVSIAPQKNTPTLSFLGAKAVILFTVGLQEGRPPRYSAGISVPNAAAPAAGLQQKSLRTLVLLPRAKAQVRGEGKRGKETKGYWV